MYRVPLARVKEDVVPSSVRNSPFVLGLDLGVSSLGWALLDPRSQSFAFAGVRVFESGMDENKFERGEQGASNNVERRKARLHRRQLRRRAARQRDLFLTLQEAGFLPAEPNGDSPESRHCVLEALDRLLARTWAERIQAENQQIIAPQHVLPYFLRARALDYPLELHELGRALYHLGQRRGYLSNRREGRSLRDDGAGNSKKPKLNADDDNKQVLAEIAGLEAELATSDARTIGEYLSRKDPALARIRTIHTARKMFEAEFEKIWAAQQPHHPGCMSTELKQVLHKLFFDQRPISAGRRGMCELERNCQRADMYTLAAQRFRLLQKLNDLAVIYLDDEKRELSSDERLLLMQRLEEQGDITFEQARILLRLPKRVRFNLAIEGDKKIPGNRTNAVMLQSFGDRWRTIADSERKHIVRVWAETEQAEALANIATHEWGLDVYFSTEAGGRRAGIYLLCAISSCDFEAVASDGTRRAFQDCGNTRLWESSREMTLRISCRPWRTSCRRFQTPQSCAHSPNCGRWSTRLFASMASLRRSVSNSPEI